MDVIAEGPVRGASILWRPAHGGVMLTVVCKATYALSPGESPLADEQEYINEDDNHWNDDPARSLYSPSDLVPFKLRADVMLVGHAFAPRGEPARSITARLLVGDIDKSIEIFGDRAWLYDRTLHEGARFAKMPLRYERAAGGPETSNPVGIRSDSRDAYGNTPIPNLQPAGLSINGPEDVFGPINFGPIAPMWTERADKLGRHAASWAHAGWSARALPDDIDPSFFNAAPRDQQVPELRDNERIVLDNLHPSHPHLVTSLSGARPYAFVERPGAPPQEVALKPDTLWIDTDRSICTLTFRGQIKVDGPSPAGRVLVAMARPGQRLTWADVQRLHAGEGGAAEETPDLTVEVMPDPDEEPDQTPLLSQIHLTNALPLPAPAPAPLGAAPPWLAQSPAAPPSQRNKPPSVPAPPMHLPAPVPPPRSAQSTPTPLAAPLPLPAPAPAPVPAPAPSVLYAAPAAISAQRTSLRDVLDLLWYDPTFVDRVREEPKWRELLASLKPKTASADPGALKATALGNERTSAERRGAFDVFGVLARAPVTDLDAIRGAMAEGVADDGTFTRPLLVLSGDLTFPFDEIEALKAAITAAEPRIAGNTKLLSAVNAANELLKAPWLRSSSGLAEGATALISEAFALGDPTGSPGYLDARAERTLLDQRHYQRRTVFGELWIRSSLASAHAKQAIPTYLPDNLSKILPMFRTMRVRIIAEAHVQQDQYEASPIALRVVALGRLTSLEVTS